MTPRSCPTCRIEFATNGRGRPRVYCSTACQNRRPRRSPKPKKALREVRCACGATFETRQSRRTTCSTRCYDIARGAVRAVALPMRTCALPDCGASYRPLLDRQRCCCERHGKILCNREGRASGRYVDVWNDKRRDHYHRRRARIQGASTGRPVIFAEIAERDQWRCGICRKAVSTVLAWPHPESPSLDHIIPLTEDGSEHDPRNVRLAHLTCNTSRGNRGGGEQLLLFG